VEGVDRVKEGGRALSPSASWAENTIITERTQESGHRQSMYSLFCGKGCIVIWLHASFEIFCTDNHESELSLV
jgi:hypothetical protein